jgi:hypothetical protein
MADGAGGWRVVCTASDGGPPPAGSQLQGAGHEGLLPEYTQGEDGLDCLDSTPGSQQQQLPSFFHEYQASPEFAFTPTTQGFNDSGMAAPIFQGPGDSMNLSPTDERGFPLFNRNLPAGTVLVVGEGGELSVEQPGVKGVGKGNTSHAARTRLPPRSRHGCW